MSVLFLRFYARLFRYGMHFSSSEEVVKDGIQKLFFRLWKKRKILGRPQSIDGYLYVSLRRILLRSNERERARKNRNTVFTEGEPKHMLSVEDLIILQEKKEEREKIFREALQELTVRQQEALLLRLDSGLSNQEIARVMGLSDKRVRNLIYEATKRLRERICKLTE